MFPRTPRFGSRHASKRASSALSAAVVAAIACVSTLALAGCGSGGDNSGEATALGGDGLGVTAPSGATGVSGGATGSFFNVSPYAGRTYIGGTMRLELPDLSDFTGALSITIGEDGSPFARFTIEDPARPVGQRIIATVPLYGKFAQNSDRSVRVDGRFRFNDINYDVSCSAYVPELPDLAGGEATYFVKRDFRYYGHRTTLVGVVENETFAGTITKTDVATVTVGAFQVKNRVSYPHLENGSLSVSLDDADRSAPIQRLITFHARGLTEGADVMLPKDGLFEYDQRKTTSGANTIYNSFRVRSGKIHVVTASEGVLVLRFDDVVLTEQIGGDGSLTLNGIYTTLTGPKPK